MADKSQIEWTDATWNPVTGCTKVSAGCAYCYIEHTPPFRMAQPRRRFVRGATGVQLHPERLAQPLRWRRPRRVFVNSLSDLWHDDIPDEYIDKVFAVMALTPQHTYQVLTKRPARMREYFSSPWGVGSSLATFTRTVAFIASVAPGTPVTHMPSWPLPNVWLGVTVENQRWTSRIDDLRHTPAAVRFVSCEPLLGPLDLRRCRAVGEYQGHPVTFDALSGPGRLDWVIAGGESGGPEYRRLIQRCNPTEWAGVRSAPEQRLPCSRCNATGWAPKPAAIDAVRSIRDQCQTAGVPFFFKQWGGPRPKSGGRLLDGRTWDELPAALTLPSQEVPV